MAAPWEAGPARPRAAAGTVDVWRADLDGEAVAAARALLDAEEQARAARFASPRDGERWTAARGVVRAVLAAYLDAEARALRFAAGPHGKPALTLPAGSDGGAVPAPRFNVSHSGPIALVAVALDVEVGVDVEVARRTVDAVAIAERFLAPGEADRLRALAPADRGRAFLRAWARHEAAVKCLGVGIGAVADAAVTTDVPWVAELEISDDAGGAVAAATAPRELRTWRWPPAAA